MFRRALTTVALPETLGIEKVAMVALVRHAAVH